MQHHIRLDDLLERNLAVQWFEGVAIVQQVCRQILGEFSWNGGFPAASEVLLATDGTISIIGKPAGGSAVSGAAHALAGMLSEDVPVRLRLLVTEATGADGVFSSLAEFSDALAYFERPDAEQVIRDLVDRAATAARRHEPRTPLALPVDPAVPAPGAEQPLKKGVSRAALAAAAVAAMLCISVWIVGFSSAGPRVTSLLALPSGAGAAPPAESSPLLAKATTAAGKTATKNHRPPRAAALAATSGAAGVGPGGGPQAAPNRAAGGAESARGEVPPVATANEPPSGEPVFTDFDTIVVMASAGPDEADGGRLYSKADPRVKPPRQVYPKLPTEPPDISDTALLTIIELVVAQDGLVERVRLLSPPRDVHEYMMVAAAKAWRFEPALLDGHAVRFLHRIPLTTP